MTPLVRAQIAALIALTGLVLFSQSRGPEAVDGAIRLDRIESNELSARSFTLGSAASLVVTSAAARGADERFEAYGWIVDRASRRVVYQPSLATLRSEGRGLAQFADTLRLDAGTYDVFYTPFGNDEDGGESWINFSSEDRWLSSRDEWFVQVVRLDGADLDGERWRYRDARPSGADVLWTSGDSDGTQVVQVTRPDSLVIDVLTAEMDRRGDQVRLEQLPDGEVLWRLSDASSAPAGGSERYTHARTALALNPGFYRLTSDISLSTATRWQANPPLDVGSYGVTARTVGGGIRPFSAWSDDLAPSVSISRPGNDEDVRQPFTVARSVDLIVYAMGEVRSDTRRLDYAWIRNVVSGKTIWELKRSDSRPAGGDSNLRVAEEVVRLKPGQYELVWRSDNSRSFADDFLGDAPNDPDRWGAYLFAPFDSSAIAAQSIMPPVSRTPLASILEVRSDRDQTALLQVDQPTEVSVEALLEADSDGRWYDTATLTHVGDGEEVWSVERVDAEPDARNDDYAWGRSVLTLSPGTYTLRVVTDGDRAFGDWDSDGPPSQPGAYGLAIYPLIR